MDTAFPRGRGDEPASATTKKPRASNSSGPASGRLFGTKKSKGDESTSDRKKGDRKPRRPKSESKKPVAVVSKLLADGAAHNFTRADELTFKVSCVTADSILATLDGKNAGWFQATALTQLAFRVNALSVACSACVPARSCCAACVEWAHSRPRWRSPTA